MAFIRFYHHDLFPEFSGIGFYDGDSWKQFYSAFSVDDLEFLRLRYPQALIQNVPLPDLRFAS